MAPSPPPGSATGCPLWSLLDLLNFVPIHVRIDCFSHNITVEASTPRQNGLNALNRAHPLGNPGSATGDDTSHASALVTQFHHITQLAFVRCTTLSGDSSNVTIFVFSLQKPVKH